MSTIIINKGEIGCDYATLGGGKTPVWVAARTTHTGRYITATTTSWKALKPVERDVIFKAGSSIYLIWEVDAERPLKGRSQGAVDGVTAATRAINLGYPMDCPIFAAADIDVFSSNIKVCEEYFRAFHEACSYPMALYGDHDIAQRIIDICEYVIVPNASAWSSGIPPMNVVARQGREDKVIGWDYPTVVVRPFPAWSGVAVKPPVVVVPPAATTPPIVVVPPIVVPVPPVQQVPVSADAALLVAQTGSDMLYFFYNSDNPTDPRRYLSNGFGYRHIELGEAAKLVYAKLVANGVDTAMPLTTVEIAEQTNVGK